MMIKIRPREEELSTLREARSTPLVVARPNTKNRMRAGIPAARLYQTRVRTAAMISTSCPMEEVMVTSEMGERLLPNSEPEQMAPRTRPAGQPICTPIGNSMGIVAKRAAAELPVTVDITAHSTKVTQGIMAGGILTRLTR